MGSYGQLTQIVDVLQKPGSHLEFCFLYFPHKVIQAILSFTSRQMFIFNMAVTNMTDTTVNP